MRAWAKVGPIDVHVHIPEICCIPDAVIFQEFNEHRHAPQRTRRQPDVSEAEGYFFSTCCVVAVQGVPHQRLDQIQHVLRQQVVFGNVGQHVAGKPFNAHVATKSCIPLNLRPFGHMSFYAVEEEMDAQTKRKITLRVRRFLLVSDLDVTTTRDVLHHVAQFVPSTPETRQYVRAAVKKVLGLEVRPKVRVIVELKVDTTCRVVCVCHARKVNRATLNETVPQTSRGSL